MMRYILDPDKHMKLYINNKKQQIIFLIISNYNYFMDIQNLKNKDGFFTFLEFQSASYSVYVRMCSTRDY